MGKNIQIIQYDHTHQPSFERLNRAWIEKMFVMEPLDIAVLTDPETHILSKGGYILMASCDGEIAGTVGLKKVNDDVMELTKMAVDPLFQRLGIAQLLCEAALEKAKEMGAKKVILYSQTLQKAAIALYRKLGFYEVDLEQGVYSRANIKMQYDLYPMTREERNELVKSYGASYEKVKAAVALFPKEMWQWKPSSTQWSIQENLVHLADSEANSYIRCRRLIAEPGSKVLGYDQDIWATQLKYHEQNAADALNLFGMMRQMTYQLLKNLPEEVWENTVDHSERGIMPFTEWLRVYENHTHIGQMRRVHEAWKKQSTNQS